MSAPCTYAQWSDTLDRFDAGLEDGSVVDDIVGGTLEWTSGVAPRFSERIHDSFQTRLQRCSDRLTRGLAVSSDHGNVLMALLDARRTLSLLHRMANATVFPEVLREHLEASVHRYAEQVQRCLEESARSDSSGRLSSLVRHHNLLRYDQLDFAQLEAPEQPNSANNTIIRHRTILV